MKIAVIGAGGVGGYFGGKMAAAGFDVTFIARGKSLRAIKNNGLQVKSIHGNFITHPAATDNLSKVKESDLIILCVKSWQVSQLAIQIQPYITEKTVVLPLQNGADNVDKLISVLKPHNVIAGLCKIVSKIEAPGIIHHFGYEPEIIFGEMDNIKTERIQKIKKVFDQSEFKNTISENIYRDIWKKFLFITTISGIGALTESVLGILREDTFLRQKMRDTAFEIIKIANKKGIDLHEVDIEKTFAIIDKLDFNTTSSLQRDIMESKPSELLNFNGFIEEQGKELNIATPVNSFIYHSLLPKEKKVRNQI